MKLLAASCKDIARAPVTNQEHHGFNTRRILLRCEAQDESSASTQYCVIHVQR